MKNCMNVLKCGIPGCAGYNLRGEWLGEATTEWWWEVRKKIRISSGEEPSRCCSRLLVTQET